MGTATLWMMKAITKVAVYEVTVAQGMSIRHSTRIEPGPTYQLSKQERGEGSPINLLLLQL